MNDFSMITAKVIPPETVDINYAETMQYLIEDKSDAIVLIFSNRDELFWTRKEVLSNMAYFKNLFESDKALFDNTIVEIHMSGILDNFSIFADIHRFLRFNSFGYTGESQIGELYQLAIMSQCLGEVKIKPPYNKKYPLTLLSFIRSKVDDYRFKNVSKEFFDTLHKLSQIIGTIAYPISVINEKSGFIGSLLHLNACPQNANRIEQIIKGYGETCLFPDHTEMIIHFC